MNGYEATHELRQSGFTRPVIALTAHAMRGQDERCLQNGFSAFVAQPVNASELVRVVESHLGRSEDATDAPRPLVSALAGDRHLESAIALFAERLSSRASRLRAAMASDRQQAAALAHQLKGAGAMAGYQ